jgi:hypothetical protein
MSMVANYPKYKTIITFLIFVNILQLSFQFIFKQFLEHLINEYLIINIFFDEYNLMPLYIIR